MFIGGDEYLRLFYSLYFIQQLLDILKNRNFCSKYKGFYMVNVHDVRIPYL